MTQPREISHIIEINPAISSQDAVLIGRTGRATDQIFVNVVPAMPRILNNWVRQSADQSLVLNEVLHIEPVGQLRVSRMFTKHIKDEKIRKNILIDILRDQSMLYRDVQVHLVAEFIPMEEIYKNDKRNVYEEIYSDNDVRVITHLQVVDDPTQDRGVDIYTTIILEIPIENELFPVNPSIVLPE